MKNQESKLTEEHIAIYIKEFNDRLSQLKKHYHIKGDIDINISPHTCATGSNVSSDIDENEDSLKFYVSIPRYVYGLVYQDARNNAEIVCKRVAFYEANEAKQKKKRSWWSCQ